MELVVDKTRGKPCLFIKNQSFEFEQFLAVFSYSNKDELHELQLIQLDSSYEICVTPMSHKNKLINLSIYDISQSKVKSQVLVGKKEWLDFADALLHIRYRSLGKLNLWSTYQGFSIGTPLFVRFTRRELLWEMQISKK